jgi:hypothetical protein
MHGTRDGEGQRQDNDSRQRVTQFGPPVLRCSSTVQGVLTPAIAVTVANWPGHSSTAAIGRRPKLTNGGQPQQPPPGGLAQLLAWCHRVARRSRPMCPGRLPDRWQSRHMEAGHGQQATGARPRCWRLGTGCIHLDRRGAAARCGVPDRPLRAPARPGIPTGFVRGGQSRLAPCIRPCGPQLPAAQGTFHRLAGSSQLIGAT